MLQYLTVSCEWGLSTAGCWSDYQCLSTVLSKIDDEQSPAWSINQVALGLYSCMGEVCGSERLRMLGSMVFLIVSQLTLD